MSVGEKLVGSQMRVMSFCENTNSAKSALFAEFILSPKTI